MAGIRAIFEKYDIKPRKKFGQNFLVQDGYLKAIARCAKLTKDDVALEIGAGIGNLTRELAVHAGKVIAVEFDRDMLRVLRGELNLDNVEIVEADALRLNYRELSPGKKIIAAANLPYNIATEIVFRMLETHDCFSRMLLMTQLEVARRFTAKIGTKDYGPLAVLTGLWSSAKVEMILPPGAFFPRPKIDSAVLRFEIRDVPAAEINSPELFSKIVHAAFSQRRKMISNSLGSTLAPILDKKTLLEWLDASKIKPTSRAQELDVSDFARLERNFSQFA